MNKFKRLLPGHDFRDDISQVPEYSTPCSELMGFDQPFGEVPDILDPTKTYQLGLGVYDVKGDWTSEERREQPRDISCLSIPHGPSRRATREYSAPRTINRISTKDVYTYDASDFQVEEVPETEFQLTLRPKWADRMREKLRKAKKSGSSTKYHDFYDSSSVVSTSVPTISEIPEPVDLSGPSSSALLLRSLARKTVVMRPVDSLADLYPQLIGPILLIESAMVAFALYEVYVLLDGVLQTVKALCLPLILLSKLVGV